MSYVVMWRLGGDCRAIGRAPSKSQKSATFLRYNRYALPGTCSVLELNFQTLRNTQLLHAIAVLTYSSDLHLAKCVNNVAAHIVFGPSEPPARECCK